MYTYAFVNIITRYRIPFGLWVTVAAAFIKKLCPIVEQIIIVSEDSCRCQGQETQQALLRQQHDD
jgi:hypothetical protein